MRKSNEAFYRVGCKLVSSRINSLEEKKEVLVNYLKIKTKEEDWHGVADAAMDIREIVSQLEILRGIK